MRLYTGVLILVMSALGAVYAEERIVDFYGFIDLEYEYDDTKNASTFDLHQPVGAGAMVDHKIKRFDL